jgi:hypothetical protein
MKLKKSDVESLLKSIDNLLELKTYIRKIAPTYELTNPYDKQIIETLQSLQEELDPIFSEYLQGEEKFEVGIGGGNKKEKIVDVISSGNKALISSNSAKDILKEWGLDPRKLIVTGGPLFLEDYQKVNPDIPDHALEGIKKKCEGIMETIENENWEDKDLYFIYETENRADTYTYEKIGRISDLIGKRVKVIKISSWDDF